jgi:plasmid rolling circle replication initiator protein Rep
LVKRKKNIKEGVEVELKKDYFIKCISKKNIAMLNAAYIDGLGLEKVKEYGKDFKRRLNVRSKRIINCLNHWEWNKYEENKVLDLQKIYRCKDLFCPNCRKWNVAKALVNFNPYFKDLLTKGYCPYLMTLTVPNVKGELLGEEVNRFNKAFYTLWRWLSCNNGKGYDKRLFNAVACVRAIELNVNEERYDFHIHIHAIIFLENDNKADFFKRISGGYRKISSEFIYYSNADIFIQKLWTMAYKNINVTGFDSRSDDWRDNNICDIRELEMPGGINEVFKYCFKDMQILDIKIFEYLFFALLGRRLRQGYGLLYGLKNNDDVDVMDLCDDISKYLSFNEVPEKLICRSISEMVVAYKDYKKVSRFKLDKEYENIKE